MVLLSCSPSTSSSCLRASSYFLHKALDLQFGRLELHLAEPYVFRQLAVDVKKCRLFLIILDLPILLGRLDLLVNDIDLAQPFVITVEVGEGLPGFDRVADLVFSAKQSAVPAGTATSITPPDGWIDPRAWTTRPLLAEGGDGRVSCTGVWFHQRSR